MSDKDKSPSAEENNSELNEELLEFPEPEALGDDLLSKDDSEDLLSEFDEIIADVTGESSGEDSDSKEGLDSDIAELEAFLEDFDTGQEQEAAEEPMAEQSADGEREVELDAEELELSDPSDADDESASVEQLDEVPVADQSSISEPSDDSVEGNDTVPDIFTATDELEEQFNESLAEAGLLPEEDEEQAEERLVLEEAIEVADIAEPDEVESDIPVEMEAIELPLESLPEEPEPARAEQSATVMAAEPQQQGPGRQVVLGGFLLLAVALVAAVGGVWMTLGLKSEVTSLNAGLAALEQDSQSKSRGDQEIVQMRSDLLGLQQRLSEIALIIEGPMSHLQESSKAEFQQLSERLAKMEMSLSELKKRPSAVPKPAPVAGQGATENWIVNLVSLTSNLEATRQVQRLKEKGVNAVVRHAEVDGKRWYRLQVIGFPSKDEARAFANEVEATTGLKNAWVGKE